MPNLQPLTGPAAQRCPLCGGFNQCTPAQTGQFADDCWCRTTRIAPEVLARIPAGLRLQACLCPACATGVALPAD
ncbi:MAG: cysteine-rich CWC family protein [Burkholderiales bacterium]